jgi:hypothetical protein
MAQKQSVSLPLASHSEIDWGSEEEEKDDDEDKDKDEEKDNGAESSIDWGSDDDPFPEEYQPQTEARMESCAVANPAGWRVLERQAESLAHVQVDQRSALELAEQKALEQEAGDLKAAERKAAEKKEVK